MKAHLQRPDAVPAPPAMHVYRMERRFHEAFGVPAPPLAQWPHRKILEYLLIMQVEDEHQAAKDAAAGSGRSAPAGADRPAQGAAATEEAFQRMRAQAVPPPMPPPPA